jgi:ribonuclease R
MKRKSPPTGTRPADKAAKPRKAAPWLPDVLVEREAKAARGGDAARRGPRKPEATPSKRSQGPVPGAGTGATITRTAKPGVRSQPAPRGGPRPPGNPRPDARASATPRGVAGARKGSVAGPHAARESERYDSPITSREAILAFLSESSELMTAERLATALGHDNEKDLDALIKRLSAMVRDGQLLVNRRGGYGVAEKLDLIPGSVIANADGFGFLRPDAGGGDDLFLPPVQMRGVLHGDRVLACVTGIDRRGRREGAIVEVLERRTTRLVGRYKEERGFGLVTPDDRRIHQDLLIPQGKDQGAHTGQIVVAEIEEPPTRERQPVGRVVAVLGDRLSASLTVRMAIESSGIPNEWPQAVLDEAASVDPNVLPSEHIDRVDLRDVPLVTIDGADARDFDDAVFCEPNGQGFRLIVAIADVSHYVRTGTALDDEAHSRATSVYFPDFVVPMLPETLSNGICSLNPHVERLCMVCEMQVDRDGDILRSRFYAAVMRSHARLTYTEVWNAIGERDPDTREKLANVMPQLDNLYALYKALSKQRQRRGAIDFDSQEYTFRLAPTGEVLAMGAYERNDAHKLIEECMIAANVEAARFIERKKLPAPFRVHAPPPGSKYEDLLEFLQEFQLRMPPHDEVKPGDFAALIKKVKKRPDSGLIESVLLRSQSLAVYQATNHGHFGLALDAYAHFTSPIRRYPDLLLHRAIRHALIGGKPSDYQYGQAEMEALCAHCSKCERRADEAERDVDERYKCAWMEKHVGSEFDGVISGVTSFGLFVELVENRVNGLVHVTQLPNDYYHFDAGKHLITGERRGLKFRLGDKVRVLVLRASLEDRKIDFRLVQQPASGLPAEHVGKPTVPLPPASTGRPSGKSKRR